MAAQTATGAGGRRTGLDGLRGVAALVVLLHHTLLTTTGWADPYRGAAGTWIAYTPLHVLVDGTLAVYVFFVLSGFVLVRQLDQGARRYYVSRMIRLYLPVWGAVAFAAACAAVVDRRADVADWWLAVHAGALNLHGALDEATLWRNTWLNSVLWSLRWEVVFSLLLPVYVVLARRTRSISPVASVLALLTLSGAGASLHHDSWQYLPVFGLGVLLATHEQSITEFSNRRAREVAGLALCAASIYWVLQWTSSRSVGWLLAAATSVQICAAAAIVAVVAKTAWVERGLSRPLPRWLGSRSFALYLIHEPIVVSVGLLSHQLWLTMLIAVPLSLLVAEIFFRLVERPSHRLSRAAGLRVMRARAMIRPRASRWVATTSRT